MGWLRRLFTFEPMPATIGGRAVRIYTLLFLLCLAGVSGLACWAFPRQDRLARARASRLSSVEGVVDSTEARKYRSRRGGTYWEVSVWYSFEVGGRTWRGSRLDFSHGDETVSYESAALEFRERYADGRRVTVWYDRADPQDSALDPGYVPVTTYVIPAAMILALTLTGALLGVRDLLRQSREHPLPPAEIRKALVIGRNATLLLGASAAAVLLIQAVTLVIHHTSIRPNLVTTGPYIRPDLSVQTDPPAPRVDYLFGPEGVSGLQQGTAWRFGRQAVRSDAEAEAVIARLREDFVAGRLRIHYLRTDPSRSALSPDHGGVVAPGLLLASGLAPGLAAPLTVLCHRRSGKYASGAAAASVPSLK